MKSEYIGVVQEVELALCEELCEDGLSIPSLEMESVSELSSDCAGLINRSSSTGGLFDRICDGLCNSSLLTTCINHKC